MFYRWMRQLNRAVDLMIETHIAEAGLNLNAIQLMVLAALIARDGQRPMDLAQVVGYTPTSFTPVIDSLLLIDDAWAERRENPNDRRSVQIFLTPRAWLHRDRIEAAYKAAEKSMAMQIDTFISRLPVLEPEATVADTVAVVS